MFDIGFSELMVIGVVALIVIGPERLPRVARTLGHLAGRLQRYVADVKADINREIELEDLRKMRDSMQQAAAEFRGNFEAEMNKVESGVKQTAEELQKTTDEINQSLAEAQAPEPAAAKPENAGKPEDAKQT